MKPILIRERYRVDERIGEGGFSLVYSGTDSFLNEEVAIKLRYIRDEEELSILETEAKVYEALSGSIGIPKMFWFGSEGSYRVLIHELLGPSLEDLLNYCDRRLSLKTVLLLADQAINRIEHIHNKGFLHRDIKPDNFLMGLGRQGNTLYLIDFGLTEELHEIRKTLPSEGLSFLGTRRYASVNAHQGREQSWRDDLESLGYVLLYCLRGSLPWVGISAETEKEKDDMIQMRKTTITVEELCDDAPREFTTYMTYVRALGFNDRPDYRYLRQAFRRLFKNRSFKYDHVFDWTEKLFRQNGRDDADLEMSRPSRQMTRSSTFSRTRTSTDHLPPIYGFHSFSARKTD